MTLFAALSCAQPRCFGVPLQLRRVQGFGNGAAAATVSSSGGSSSDDGATIRMRRRPGGGARAVLL
eukprot:SAG31_NODE_19060_length_613_cov_0.935798_2_plen_65_part_01